MSCCLRKSTVNAFLSSGKAMRALHFSYTHRANEIQHDLVKLSCGDFSFLHLDGGRVRDTSKQTVRFSCLYYTYYNHYYYTYYTVIAYIIL